MDFLEDTAINLLIFFALGRSLARRARVGMVLPALAFLWSLVQKYLAPVPPRCHRANADQPATMRWPMSPSSARGCQRQCILRSGWT